MPNKFYLSNPYLTGVLDFATMFDATRDQKDAIEKGYQAQADAQENAAWASFGSNVAGGAIGGIAANMMGGKGVASDAATGQALDAAGNPAMSNMERFAFASSFVPALRGEGGPSRMAAALGGDARNFQQRSALQREGWQQAMDLDTARTQNDLYADAVSQFNQVALGASAGRVPSAPGPSGAMPGPLGPAPNMSQASGGVGVGVGPVGQAPSAPPGGVPLPVIDPTTIPIYRQAEQDVREIVTEAQAIQRDSTIPMAEKAQRIAMLTPRMAAAQRILAPTRQPPPPTTEEQLIQGGAIIKAADGGVYERDPRTNGYNYKAGSKSSEYQNYVASASEVLVMQKKADPIKAREEAKKQWMYEQLGGKETYDAIVADGGRPYLDKDGDVKVWEPKKKDADDWTETFNNAVDAQVKATGRADIKNAKDVADEVVHAKQHASDSAALNQKLKEAVSRPVFEGINEAQFASIMREITRLYPNKADVPDNVKRTVDQLDARLHPQGTRALITGPR